MTAQLNAHSSVPLYRQLIDSIKHDITTGELKPGDQIPSEIELSEEYQVSRLTVRNAVSILAEEGLVEKVQGKGTYVHSQPQRSLDYALGTTKIALNRGIRLSTKTLQAGYTRANQEQADFFNISPESKLVMIRRVRYLNGYPSILETLYFTPEFELLMTEDLNQSLYSLLGDKYHIVPGKGHKCFEICFADRDESENLCVPAGTPLILCSDGILDTTGNPLHTAKTVYRTDRFKVYI
ncbi:MAG TPA: GntR family transcriptional regulator [Clostridia bacterium]|nr:GntR family transcriptional regulator [Clostridia bacterium]